MIRTHFIVPKIPLFDTAGGNKIIDETIRGGILNALNVVKAAARVKGALPVGATGMLFKSLKDKVSKKGLIYYGEVGPQIGYAPHVEYGTGPAKKSGGGKVMLLSLKKWLRDSTKGQSFMAWYSSAHPAKNQAKTLANAAKFLKYSIHRRGIKRQNYWSKLERQTLPGVYAELNKILPVLSRVLKKAS